MPYTRPYTGGFKDYPDTTTPINATALNTMDVGIKTANDQFQTVTTAQRTALSPTVGQAVWDSDLKQLMVYMNASGGNAWQAVGNTIICTSTTRPSTPFHGQVIYETDTKKEYRYNGSAWVQTNSTSTTSGVTGVSNLIVPSVVKARAVGTQVVSSGAGAVVQWGAADDYDTDNMHDTATNNTRIYANTAGVYIVNAFVRVTATIAAAYNVYFTLNGTATRIADFALESGATVYGFPVSFVYAFSAGDYFEVFFYQTSGANRTIDGASFVAASWIGRTS